MSSHGSTFLSLLITLLLTSAASAAGANVVITVNKATQEMTVAVNGEALYHWPASTGRAGYETPSGTFHVFRMEVDHVSKEWDDAPMPHSLFFTKIGHAIHGYHATRRIGTPASHGCVRLAPQNAATLYALVEREGMLNTTVVLIGKETANTPSARVHKQQKDVIDLGALSGKLDTVLPQKMAEHTESGVRSEVDPIGMRPSDVVFVPSATSEPKSFLPEWLERERRAQELLVKRMSICRGC
jgi:hypothetical protein